MKKINYIGLLLIVMVFSACDLDQYPYSEVAADKYVNCLLYTSDAADD